MKSRDQDSNLLKFWNEKWDLRETEKENRYGKKRRKLKKTTR